MSLKEKDVKLYDLIPSQEMILYMLTHALHKQVTQIPDSVLLDADLDFSVLKEALNIEIQRNDCMRLRFCRKGRKIKQYFLDEYRLDEVPLLSFKTEQEQTAYLTADAEKPVRYLRDETYRIIFFKSFDGRSGIYINVHHVVMDNAACFVFFSDLMAVYDHLKLGKPMPGPLGKFENRIQKDLQYYVDTERREQLRRDYEEYILKTGEPLYLGAEGPRLLEKFRKIFHNPELKAPPIFDVIFDKSELLRMQLPVQTSKKAIEFMDKYEISGENLVQLAMRLEIARINNRHKETVFLVLCPRRRTRDEKRSGGNVTGAILWRLVLEDDDTFLEAMNKLAKLQTWIFRHSDFSFNDYRKLEVKTFKYSFISSSPTMMFTWQPIEKDSINGYSYEYAGYDFGRYVLPMYTFAMKDAKHDTIRISYLHKTKFTTYDEIKSLHDNTGRILDLVTEDPTITITEIYDRIDAINRGLNRETTTV